MKNVALVVAFLCLYIPARAQSSYETSQHATEPTPAAPKLPAETALQIRTLQLALVKIQAQLQSLTYSYTQLQSQAESVGNALKVTFDEAKTSLKLGDEFVIDPETLAITKSTQNGSKPAPAASNK